MAPARTLEEVLQSTSDTLFPAELGEKEVAIDSVSSDGDTPLHVLIWRGDTEGALLLIWAGANVNAVGDMRETPLHVAVSKGNRTVIKALLSAGARTDVVSDFGKTAEDAAAERGIDLNEFT